MLSQIGYNGLLITHYLLTPTSTRSLNPHSFNPHSLNLENTHDRANQDAHGAEEKPK